MLFVAGHQYHTPGGPSIRTSEEWVLEASDWADVRVTWKAGGRKEREFPLERRIQLKKEIEIQINRLENRLIFMKNRNDCRS